MFQPNRVQGKGEQQLQWNDCWWVVRWNLGEARRRRVGRGLGNSQNPSIFRQTLNGPCSSNKFLQIQFSVFMEYQVTLRYNVGGGARNSRVIPDDFHARTCTWPVQARPGVDNEPINVCLH